MENGKCYNPTWEPNARGQLFVNDSNNIGKKMMKKMGWSQGKGLGKTLSGDPEILSVRRKLTTTGMGYEGNQHNWIANQENYDDLLIDLQEQHSQSAESSTENENCKNDAPFSKLEAKSKTSKSRLHYRKLIKGKDLSGLSAEEMECIIGSKKLRKKLKKEKLPAIETENENENSLNHVSCDNMIEYFAKKMAKRQEALLAASEAEDDLNEEEVITPISKKKKKKKSKHEKSNAGEINLDTCDHNIEVPEVPEEECVKKSKCRKRKHDIDHKEINSDEHQTENDIENNITAHQNGNIVESSKEISEKKKSKLLKNKSEGDIKINKPKNEDVSKLEEETLENSEIEGKVLDSKNKVSIHSMNSIKAKIGLMNGKIEVEKSWSNECRNKETEESSKTVSKKRNKRKLRETLKDEEEEEVDNPKQRKLKYSTTQVQNEVFGNGFDQSANEDENVVFSNHNDSLICKKIKKRKRNTIQLANDSIAVHSKKKRRKLSLGNENNNDTLSRKVTFNKNVEVFYVPLKDKTRGGALRLMKDSDWLFFDE